MADNWQHWEDLNRALRLRNERREQAQRASQTSQNVDMTGGSSDFDGPEWLLIGAWVNGGFLLWVASWFIHSLESYVHTYLVISAVIAAVSLVGWLVWRRIR
jgi:hypothetical protein